METLQDWLAHCERLHPKTIEMGLERSHAVARTMGLRFDCPVITVAGTNGKGSTCAMLESIAGQAGWRTGVYTSPHLVDFEERCRLRGEVVKAAELMPHFEKVEAARGDISLSYFEFTSLAIMSLMASSQLDVAILEVGLGGRLDMVNIIDTDCAVITSIDLDHMDYLGPDRESIGFEKAGIMRAGRPVIVSDPLPPQSLSDTAARVPPPLASDDTVPRRRPPGSQESTRGSRGARSIRCRPARKRTRRPTSCSRPCRASTGRRRRRPRRQNPPTWRFAAPGWRCGRRQQKSARSSRRSPRRRTPRRLLTYSLSKPTSPRFIRFCHLCLLCLHLHSPHC